MQTFLPYPDFEETAHALDDRRLGKQRVEALQILRAIRREGYGWSHHPVVAMWRGYEPALVRYGLTICRVWRERGFADTVAESIVAELDHEEAVAIPDQAELEKKGMLPPWLGDPALHASHRSALVRKDPEWYGPRFPDAPPDLPYLWPGRPTERSNGGTEPT